jgi:hypothetical protein
MRTLNRVTEEFVRHHRLLIERTGDDPGRFAGALNENPDLARSIVRLYEIQQRLEQHGGRNLFVVQADPNFRSAVNDFRDKWLGAYEEFRVQSYKQAAVHVSEEFMRCYGILVDRTGNHPAAVASLRKGQPELNSAINRLQNIHYALGNPQGYGSGKQRPWQLAAKAQEISRLLVDASHEFGAVRSDFQSRWAEACKISIADLFEAQPLLEKQERWRNDWLEEVLESLPDAPIAEDATGGPARPFDPSRDSAAEMIDWAEDVLLDHFDRGGFDDPDGERERALQAFNWMHETLDLEVIERRLKVFPNIIVPSHVSDKYGLEAPHGLFACLSQVRAAYVIGADLAALTLCRSVTELLIRNHYANDIPGANKSKGKGGTNLGWLIEQVQDRKECAFMKTFNLPLKVAVDRANDILHKAATGVENWDSPPGVVTEFPIAGNESGDRHRDRTRRLVIEWVNELQEMIDQAPPGNTAGAAGME